MLLFDVLGYYHFYRPEETVLCRWFVQHLISVFYNAVGV